MNDLIESNVPWAKFAHHDEIYQMICILCG